MARCRNGHENPDGAAFCSVCGASLASDDIGVVISTDRVHEEARSFLVREQRNAQMRIIEGASPEDALRKELAEISKIAVLKSLNEAPGLPRINFEGLLSAWMSG